MKRSRKVTVIAATGIMSALSIILYLFIKFPIPIFPPFLEMQISEIPALITGFAYGPISGGIVIVIRFLVKLLQTHTVGIGELSDLIIGLFFVVPSSFIYKKIRTKKGAYISFVVGIIISLISTMIANAFIIVPGYIKLYFNGNIDQFVKACSVIKGINIDNYMKYYLLFACLPFNLIRYLLVGLITFPVYKGTHKLLDKIK